MPRNVSEGLLQPNCILLPNEVLDIMERLSKEELMALLCILGGRPTTKFPTGVLGLKATKIIDEKGKMIWSKERLGKVTLVKDTKEVYEGVHKFNIGKAMEALSTDEQALLSHYKQWLQESIGTVGVQHVGKWLREIAELRDKPCYADAVKFCCERKLGAIELIRREMERFAKQAQKAPGRAW